MYTAIQTFRTRNGVGKLYCKGDTINWLTYILLPQRDQEKFVKVKNISKNNSQREIGNYSPRQVQSTPDEVSESRYDYTPYQPMLYTERDETSPFPHTSHHNNESYDGYDHHSHDSHSHSYDSGSYDSGYSSDSSSCDSGGDCGGGDCGGGCD